MSAKTQPDVFYSMTERHIYKQLKSGNKVLSNHLLDARYNANEENILYH
jgi:hypothetical protein